MERLGLLQHLLQGLAGEDVSRAMQASADPGDQIRLAYTPGAEQQQVISTHQPTGYLGELLDFWSFQIGEVTTDLANSGTAKAVNGEQYKSNVRQRSARCIH